MLTTINDLIEKARSRVDYNENDEVLLVLETHRDDSRIKAIIGILNNYFDTENSRSAVRIILDNKHVGYITQVDLLDFDKETKGTPIDSSAGATLAGYPNLQLSMIVYKCPKCNFEREEIYLGKKNLHRCINHPNEIMIPEDNYLE